MTTPSQREYTATRQIGSAAITVIHEGSFERLPILSWYDYSLPEVEARHAVPEADAEGMIRLSVNSAHVRIGGASILIDPGFGEPDPSSWWVRDLGLCRAMSVQDGLAAIGVRPEEVTHVLITHAHFDHFIDATVDRAGSRVPRYPNARYLLGRADWEGNPDRAKPDSDVAVHLGALDVLGLLDLVDDEHEVVSGVTMVHAPGESPGHCIIRIESDGQIFYHLGDLVHHPCEFEHLDLMLGDKGEDAIRASRASRDRFLAEAPPDAALVFTHGVFPSWGRLVRVDGGYHWRYSSGSGTVFG
jgi:glyoxylase-like metal-dependent hydrolase (beta-lactamase superfamily II)